MTPNNAPQNLEHLFASYFPEAHYQIVETKERKELFITALTPAMVWSLPALKINLNKALEVHAQGQELEMFSREEDAPVCWIPYGEKVLANNKVSVPRIKRGLENYLLAVNNLMENGKVTRKSENAKPTEEEEAVQKSQKILEGRLGKYYPKLEYSMEGEGKKAHLILTAYRVEQVFLRPALILNLTKLCEKYANGNGVNLLINGRNEPTQWITPNGIMDRRGLAFAEKAPPVFVEYFKALGEDYNILAQDVENDGGRMGRMVVIDSLFEYKPEEKKEQKMKDNGVIQKPTLIYKPTKQEEEEKIVNWGLGKGVNLDTMDSAYFSRRMQGYFKTRSET